MSCRNCDGNVFEHSEAQGNSYCIKCGVVIEENALAKEVEFGEKSNGAAVMMGTFIGAGQSRVMTIGVNRRHTTVESREQSLANARRHIQSIATALRISEHFVETAHRYFTLALNYNFTRGRTTQSVAAACLYIACRVEKTSHMLIDFADILQVNVFRLGSIYLKLVKEFKIKLELVDPSIYIHRFAAMLDFGDATSAVAADAARIVQRMDRDWIRPGRRPAGICGACLLMAARMHNFRRTTDEVMRVVKIGSATLQRRLADFMNTPSSLLSMSDFQTISLESTCDPPSFQVGRAQTKHTGKVAPLLPNAVKSSTGAVDPLAASEMTLKLQQFNEMTSLGSAPTVKEITDAINARPDIVATPAVFNDDKEISEDISTWSDIDDDEINSTFLNEQEVAAKLELWEEANRDYIEKMADLKRREEAGEKIPNRAPRKRRRRDEGFVDVGASAAESAKNMLKTKKLSRKINYSVIDELFNADPADGGITSIAQSHLASPLPEMEKFEYEVVEEPGIEPALIATDIKPSLGADATLSTTSEQDGVKSEISVKTEDTKRDESATAAAEDEEDEEEDFDEDDEGAIEQDYDDGYDDYNEYD